MEAIFLAIAAGVVLGIVLGYAVADELYEMEDNLYDLKFGFIKE